MKMLISTRRADSFILLYSRLGDTVIDYLYNAKQIYVLIGKACLLYTSAISRKGEIAERIADVFALVDFDGVHAVAVMPDDQIRARVDGCVSERNLTLIGDVILFLAPMIGNDNDAASCIAKRLDIAFDGGVDIFIIAVEGLVGEDVYKRQDQWRR